MFNLFWAASLFNFWAQAKTVSQTVLLSIIPSAWIFIVSGTFLTAESLENIYSIIRNPDFTLRLFTYFSSNSWIKSSIAAGSVLEEKRWAYFGMFKYQKIGEMESEYPFLFCFESGFWMK